MFNSMDMAAAAMVYSSTSTPPGPYRPPGKYDLIHLLCGMAIVFACMAVFTLAFYLWVSYAAPIQMETVPNKPNEHREESGFNFQSSF